MHVDDIRTDADVHGNGDAHPVRGGKQTQTLVGRGDVAQPRANSLSDPQAARHAFVDGGIELAPGFLRHAKAAGPERFIDLLGGRATQGELEVVDDAGAVGGNRRNVAACHQVDDDGRETGLDDVGADTPEQAPVVTPRAAVSPPAPP